MPKNDQLPLDKLPKGFDINNYKFTLPGGSFQSNGKTYMMVVATDGSLLPKGGSWMVEVNSDPAKGWTMVPGSYRAWDSVPNPNHAPGQPDRFAAPGTAPTQVSGYQAADGKSYVVTNSFDRTQPVTMYQVDPSNPTDRGAWKPWTGTGWGNPGDTAAPLSGLQNFGELSFREVEGHPVLSGFNLQTGSTEVRVGDDPTKIFGAPSTAVAAGAGVEWNKAQPGQYPQNYGGYIMPGSTLNNLGILVSQWNTSTNNPYTVEQFQVNPNR